MDILFGECGIAAISQHRDGSLPLAGTHLREFTDYGTLLELPYSSGWRTIPIIPHNRAMITPQKHSDCYCRDR